MRYVTILFLILFSSQVNSQLLYLEEEETFEAKYYPKRIQEFDRLIELDSMQIEYYFQRAALNYKLKEFEKCIDDYNLVLKRFGERRDAYANLGMAYCFLNDSARAIGNLQKSVSMDPAYARNHLNLGFVYLYFDQKIHAIPCLQKAVELDGNYAKAYYYLGYAYLVTGQLDESKKNLLKSVELAAYHPEAFYNLAVVAYKQANYREAIDYFTKSLEFRPSLASNKELFTLRGKSYEQVGEKDKAKFDLERAESISKTNEHN